jgi:hypothetical protein
LPVAKRADNQQGCPNNEHSVALQIVEIAKIASLDISARLPFWPYLPSRLEIVRLEATLEKFRKSHELIGPSFASIEPVRFELRLSK